MSSKILCWPEVLFGHKETAPTLIPYTRKRMHQYIRLILCLTALIAPNAAYAAKLSHKEYERFSVAALPAKSNKVLYVRDNAIGNNWLSVLTQSLWIVLEHLPLTPLPVTLCKVFFLPTKAILGNISQKSPATISTLL